GPRRSDRRPGAARPGLTTRAAPAGGWPVGPLAHSRYRALADSETAGPDAGRRLGPPVGPLPPLAPVPPPPPQNNPPPLAPPPAPPAGGPPRGPRPPPPPPK